MRTGTIERSILRHVNAERKKRDLRTLAGHTRLVRAARGHSRWMARSGRFSHRGKDRSYHQDRTASASATRYGAGSWMPGAPRPALGIRRPSGCTSAGRLCGERTSPGYCRHRTSAHSVSLPEPKNQERYETRACL